MIRSFVVAIVAAAALLAAVPSAAQPKPAPIPVSVTGGTPGVSIEFFMNATKLADTTVNTTGGADWVLDLSNMGKTRVTIYIDVCKDGKIVKVMFVTGSGQAPPEDDDCNRRLAAVSFESDCGAIRITLNFANWNGQVVGCGFALDAKKGALIGGGILVPVLFLVGGDDSPTAVSSTPTTTQTTSTTTTTTPQPPPAQPPVTAPAPTPTPPVTIVQVTPRFFIVLVNHPSGATTSFICGIVQIDPPVNGVTWVVAASGPGVLPNQNISGTFNSNGQAAFRLGISQTGQYTLTLNVNNQGQTQTITFPVSVGTQSFNCPTVPS